jgi:hypothetical protein
VAEGGECRRAPDRDRHEERGDRDHQLEHAVREQRPRRDHRPARRDRRTQREPAHVRRQHRRDGQIGGAEDERELPRPDSLIQERRETGEEEACEREREDDIAVRRGDPARRIRNCALGFAHGGRHSPARRRREAAVRAPGACALGRDPCRRSAV